MLLTTVSKKKYTRIRNKVNLLSAYSGNKKNKL